MSYTPQQLYMDVGPVTPVIPTDVSFDRDLRIFQLASFLEAAGWTKTRVGPNFLLTTGNAFIESYKAFGGNPANDPFWKVTYLPTGGCYYVVDDRSASTGTYPPGCGLGPTIGIGNPPEDLGFFGNSVVTGNVNPASVHRGVLIAILRTLGIALTEIQASFAADNSFGNTTVVLEPTDSTHTRIILKNTARNGNQFFNIGATLQTGATPPRGGGYTCKSEPSRKEFWRNGFGVITRGDENYVTVFFTQQQFGVAGIFMAQAGAKNFLAYPPDTPGAPAGPGNADGFHSGYGIWDPYQRVIGFADRHQVLMHTERTAGESFPNQWFVNAGGLKLMDFRRSYDDDLPITEATFFVSNDFAATGGGFDRFLWTQSSVMRIAVNGNARYQGVCCFLTPLMLARITSIPTVNLSGVSWEDGCFEGWEPWVSLNPFSAAGPAPIVGQLWDAFGDHRVTPDPLSEAPFFWDPPSGALSDRRWRRYTKLNLASPIPSGFGTLCLRASADYTPPAGPPP